MRNVGKQIMDIDKEKYTHSEKREKGRQQYRVSEGKKGSERESGD